MNIGKSLQEAREKRGLLQKDLAQMAGITQSYLSLIEGNKKEPNIKTVKALADAMGIPAPVIFFLSIEESDIKNVSKRDIFKEISPIINGMISNHFIG